MIQFQNSFCVFSTVSVMLIICCSTGLIPVIYESNVPYMHNSYPPPALPPALPSPTLPPIIIIKPTAPPPHIDPNEPCETSANYDHLSVMPNYTRPMKADTEWICNLYRTVKQLKERQLTLLVCNKGYLDVLINWLAHAILHAHYPANSILVISFDSFTHQVLQNKGFHSVHILPKDVANTRTNESIAHIWITRITVTRLLNYWNYSVLEFDSDAIMIKNIQPILNKFKNSDIIASAGIFPHNINKKWKAPTLCMGVILIRCSPTTEHFWHVTRTVPPVKRYDIDDQITTNKALDKMEVKWKQLRDEYYEGHTSGNRSLTITTMPHSVICRYRKICRLKPMNSYYVWHLFDFNKKEGTLKKKTLARDRLWVLKDNWNESLWNTNLTSEKWLLTITKPNMFMNYNYVHHV